MVDFLWGKKCFGWIVYLEREMCMKTRISMFLYSAQYQSWQSKKKRNHHQVEKEMKPFIEDKDATKLPKEWTPPPSRFYLRTQNTAKKLYSTSRKINNLQKRMTMYTTACCLPYTHTHTHTDSYPHNCVCEWTRCHSNIFGKEKQHLKLSKKKGSLQENKPRHEPWL